MADLPKQYAARVEALDSTQKPNQQIVPKEADKTTLAVRSVVALDLQIATLEADIQRKIDEMNVEREEIRRLKEICSNIDKAEEYATARINGLELTIKRLRFIILNLQSEIQAHKRLLVLANAKRTQIHGRGQTQLDKRCSS